MKQKVLSVEKLIDVYQGRSKLLAYPVTSAALSEQKTGFYIGTLPVHERGYGLNIIYTTWHFRAKGMDDFPITLVPHSHMFIREEDFLTFEGKHFLHEPNVKRKLLEFGFAQEQIQACRTELTYPFHETISFHEEEISFLANLLKNTENTPPALAKKIDKAHQVRSSFWKAKHFLQTKK